MNGIPSKRFMMLVRWEVREILLVIQSKTKWTIICVWTFSFLCLEAMCSGLMLWLSPRENAAVTVCLWGKISITRNVSQTINNASLQIYLVSINTLSPSTDERSRRQMLEFIIPTFPMSCFSKDGVQYLCYLVGSVGRGNSHLLSNFCVPHAYRKLHQ